MKAKEVYEFLEKTNSGWLNINGVIYQCVVTKPAETTRAILNRLFPMIGNDMYIVVGDLQENKKYVMCEYVDDKVGLDDKILKENIITCTLYDLKATCNTLKVIFFEV